MRISFLLPPLGMSGGIRVIAHYAEELRLRGHAVTIISAAQLGVPRFTLKGQIKAIVRGRDSLARSRPSPSHFDRFPELRDHSLHNFWFITEKDIPDADVIVATQWATAPWVASFGPSKGAKAYFIQQYETNFDQSPEHVDATWKLPLHKIVAAQWLADLSKNRFGDPRFTIATNGIDLELFNAPPRGKQARPTVSLMYSDLPPKSWATALAVLIEAGRRLPGLRIKVFGMMKPVSWLPLPEGAEFELLPEQSRIRDIYRESDVWLCTSSSEGFHLPPHEAMACRCPVVSTRVGGPMDIIRNGVNGYLAEPFDACLLAEKLIHVLSLPEPDWRRMSDEALDEARRHTWQEATDRFEVGLKIAIERKDRGEPTHAHDT